VNATPESATPGSAPPLSRSQATEDLDRVIARLLTVGTYLSVGLLAVGVLLMAATGRSPLGAGAPSFDLRRLPADLAAGRPEGFLWLGLVAVIATPTSRVVASLVAYARNGNRLMVGVSLGILGVILASVVVGLLSAAGPGA
jgi:uncharacterized membrane protein